MDALINATYDVLTNYTSDTTYDLTTYDNVTVMLTNYTSTTTYGITDDDNVTFTSTNYTSETIYSLTADDNVTLMSTNYTSDTTFDSTADDNATLAFTTLRTSRGPRGQAYEVGTSFNLGRKRTKIPKIVKEEGIPIELVIAAGVIGGEFIVNSAERTAEFISSLKQSNGITRVALVLIFAVLVYVFASRHIRAKKAEVVMPESSPRAMRTGSSASAQPEAPAV